MPIRIQCKCGKALAVKDELAGKAIRCPACKNTLKVPAPSSKQPPAAAAAPAAGSGLDDLFESEGFKKLEGSLCPQCGKEMKPGAVVCTHCGFNTQTGERLVGASELNADGTRSEFQHAALNEAALSMRRDTALQTQLQGVGLPWWMLGIIILMLIGFATVGVLASAAFGREELAEGSFLAQFSQFGVLRSLGAVLFFGSALIVGINGLIILVTAFRDTIVEGLLVLFVPFYFFIYCIKNWSRVKGPFLQWLIWSFIEGAGLAIMM